MIKNILINKFFLLLIILLIIMAISAPRIYISKIYFSPEDINQCLMLVKKNDETSISHLILYFDTKGEKDNLKYLGCYLKQQTFQKYSIRIKKILLNKFYEDLNNCPNESLSFIKNNVTIWNTFEYKLGLLLPNVLYTTLDGRDGTYRLQKIGSSRTTRARE